MNSRFTAVGVVVAAITALLVTSADAASIRGTRGNDVIRGTAKADVLRGLQGKDTLYGLRGNDTLYGGTGNDRLIGGAGADEFVCGAGVDRVVADALDAVADDCEIVSGLVPDEEPEPEPPPPPPPPPAVTAVTPGAYEGATSIGNHVFFTVTGERTITGFRINDMRPTCGNGGYIYGPVDFGSYPFRLADDGSFTYTYDGPGTVGGTPATFHERYTGRVQGAIAAGTAQIAIEWNDAGTLWRCSTELQTWTATLL
jgi:Ca2+-binding RTX toxin-like protein